MVIEVTSMSWACIARVLAEYYVEGNKCKLCGEKLSFKLTRIYKHFRQSHPEVIEGKSREIVTFNCPICGDRLTLFPLQPLLEHISRHPIIRQTIFSSKCVEKVFSNLYKCKLCRAYYDDELLIILHFLIKHPEVFS